MRAWLQYTVTILQVGQVASMGLYGLISGRKYFSGLSFTGKFNFKIKKLIRYYIIMNHYLSSSFFITRTT
jgi:hypothetical protein